MFAPDEISAEDAILAELAQLGLVLARDLQARALAADDAAAVTLALGFHRISRTVRQSLALMARLQRERRMEAAAERAEAVRAAEPKVMAKRNELRAAVRRLAYEEFEKSDAEEVIDDLFERIEEDIAEDLPALVATPAHIYVQRLRQDLGLGEQPAEAEPPEPQLRNSA
jgi:hypothetical protein